MKKNHKQAKKLKAINGTFKTYFKELSTIRDMQVMIERLVEMHPTSLAILDKMDSDIKTMHRDVLIKASGWNIPELIDEVMTIVLNQPDEHLRLRRHIEDLVKTSKKAVLIQLKRKKTKVL